MDLKVIDSVHDRVAFADTFAFIGCLLFGMASLSLVKDWQSENRPRIFRGERGEVVHFVLITGTTLSGLGILAWMFVSIWWPRVLCILLFAYVAFPWLARRLTFRSAIGSIVYSCVTLTLNFVLWRFAGL